MTDKKSYIQNHHETYKTDERWGLFGWGGSVFKTRTWETTEYIDNDPKDFIHFARNVLEDEIRASLASKGNY